MAMNAGFAAYLASHKGKPGSKPPFGKPGMKKDSAGDTYTPGATHDSAGDFIAPGASRDSKGDTLSNGQSAKKAALAKRLQHKKHH